MIPQRNLSLLSNRLARAGGRRILANTREILIRKKARLKKLWKTRLVFQMAELPEFDKVHRYVLRELRQAGFLDDSKK